MGLLPAFLWRGRPTEAPQRPKPVAGRRQPPCGPRSRSVGPSSSRAAATGGTALSAPPLPPCLEPAEHALAPGPPAGTKSPQQVVEEESHQQQQPMVEEEAHQQQQEMVEEEKEEPQHEHQQVLVLGPDGAVGVVSVLRGSQGAATGFVQEGGGLTVRITGSAGEQPPAAAVSRVLGCCAASRWRLSVGGPRGLVYLAQQDALLETGTGDAAPSLRQQEEEEVVVVVESEGERAGGPPQQAGEEAVCGSLPAQLLLPPATQQPLLVEDDSLAALAELLTQAPSAAALRSRDRVEQLRCAYEPFARSGCLPPLPLPNSTGISWRRPRPGFSSSEPCCRRRSRSCLANFSPIRCWRSICA